MKYWSKLLAIITIFCLGGILYSNTLHCSFHFDDHLFIINNFAIRNIQDLQKIWNFFPCRFFTFLSFALNYHIHQLNVFGYHLFNIAVHLASGILVWWLTILTLSTPTMKQDKISNHANLIALFAGVIFVSHPLQTESVTYIWQRAASMATMFYLASLCFYIKSRLLHGRGIFYICSLISAILAMLTKETSITLPLLILLYEFIFLKEKGTLNWKKLSPFLFAIFIIPSITLLSHSENVSYIRGSPGVPGGITPIQYTLTQFRVMVTYIRLAFIPVNQNFDYDYPISNSILELPILFSFLFLIAILYSAQRLYPKYKLISFSIFWFLINFLPESIPFPVKDVIFEHRLYLPLVGYSIFLVGSGYYIFGDKYFRTLAFLLIIITFYSVLTYQRNKVWRDDFTLWQDTVQKSPHKARPYNYMGIAFADKREYAKAISDFTKAIEMDPQLLEAYNNRGNIYGKQGKFSQAIADYSKAIEIEPIFPAYYNRGVIYYKYGYFTQAMSDFNKVIEINHRFAKAYYYRSLIDDSTHHEALALGECKWAIELCLKKHDSVNDDKETLFLLMDILIRKKDFTDLKKYAYLILDHEKNPKILTRLGARMAQINALEIALDCFIKAIKVAPNYKDAYLNAGIFLGNLGKYDQSLSVLRLGASIDLKDQRFQEDIGKVLELKSKKSI